MSDDFSVWDAHEVGIGFPLTCAYASFKGKPVRGNNQRSKGTKTSGGLTDDEAYSTLKFAVFFNSVLLSIGRSQVWEQMKIDRETLNSKLITIISVSWYSSELLNGLFNNLLKLADTPASLRFLVADNSNGADNDLKTLDFPDLTIIPVDVENYRMSVAHAIGLNVIFSSVNTPYTLIIDPDVMLFKRGWDTAFLETLRSAHEVALGAPYPGWKLGKYHDFPSPPFALWQTDHLKVARADWTPYGTNPIQRLIDFSLRQIFWGPRLIDRKLLRLPPRTFRVSHKVEQLVGVVSKDTGWRIAEEARRRKWCAHLFEVVPPWDDSYPLPQKHQAAYRVLASEFELYAWQGVPILTHRNPTFTRISFNLWTNRNITIYQNKSDVHAQSIHWRELVDDISSDLV